MEAITSVVDFVPAEVGINVTFIVQLWPAEIVGVTPGHVPGVTLNIALSPPDKDVEFIVRVAVPVLVIVKPCELEVPPLTFPKFFDAGEIEIRGAAIESIPLPALLCPSGFVTTTFCGPTAAPTVEIFKVTCVGSV